MQPNPVLLQIGPVTIYWYGVLIVTGAMLATYIASRLSSRNGHDPEIAWNLLIVCLVLGVIGARIYHIISSWEYYRLHPSEMFGLQMSGFGIFGAVAGGLVAVWGFAKVFKLRFLEWCDYIAPGLILAQAIGRWGNFFNQELYGLPTDLPWGIYISPEHRLPQFAAFERFHPTFLYESTLNFIGFLILLYLARNWRKNRQWGDIFFSYCIIYPIIRFLIEFQRPDAWVIGGMPTAQWVSLGMILLAVSLMLIRRKLRRPSMMYAPGEPWQAPEDEQEMDEDLEKEPVSLEAPSKEPDAERDDVEEQG